MGFYLLRGGRKSDGRPRTVSGILQILHSTSSPAGVPPGTECEFARLSGPLIAVPSHNYLLNNGYLSIFHNMSTLLLV